MSRRNEYLISNYEEAKEWFDEFKYTIADEQVLKVIEHLENDDSEEVAALRKENGDLAEELNTLENDFEELRNELFALKNK